MRPTDPARIKMLREASGYFAVINAGKLFYQGYPIMGETMRLADQVIASMREMIVHTDAHVPMEHSLVSTTIRAFPGVAEADRPVFANLCGAAAATSGQGEHGQTAVIGAALAILSHHPFFMLRAEDRPGSVYTTFQPVSEGVIAASALVSGVSFCEAMTHRIEADEEVRAIKSALMGKQLRSLGITVQ